MPIDSSVYFQQKGLSDSLEKGMRMRDMMDDRQRKQAEYDRLDNERKAMAGAIAFDDKGNASLNGQTLGELAQVNPEKALELQNKFSEKDAAAKKAGFDRKLKEVEFISNIVGSVSDQASWDRGLAKARELGMDVSQMPAQYDPSLVKQIGGWALTQKDRLEQENKGREFGLKEKDQKIAQQKIAQEDRRWNKEFGLKEREQGNKDLESVAKVAESQGGTKEDKKNKKEFDNRFNNIKTVISTLKQKIKDDGTHDFTGGHNENLSALIDSIAIDSAKMFDPESVARESEVAAFKKMLFEPGLTTRNATAQEILANYESMLEKRAQTLRTGQPVIESDQKTKQPQYTLGGQPVADQRRAAAEILKARQSGVAKGRGL